jgi:hypothetical protein
VRNYKCFLYLSVNAPYQPIADALKNIPSAQVREIVTNDVHKQELLEIILHDTNEHQSLLVQLKLSQWTVRVYD